MRELLRKALETIASLRTQVDAMNCEPTEELTIEQEIKSALARPDEPVAWMTIDRSTNRRVQMVKLSGSVLDEYELIQFPLYLSQSPMQSLTDDERSQLAELYNSTSVSVSELIDAVESALIEKNK